MAPRPLLALLFAALAGVGSTPQAWAQAVPLKVAAVQMRSTFDVSANAAFIAGQLEKLSAQGVQVAVFPECALTGYTTRADFRFDAAAVAQAEAEIIRLCAKLRIAIVLGTVYPAGGKLFNAALIVNSRGEVVERFGKLQLAGEKWATPGNHMALFELEGVLSTVIICHDERYPEFVRIPALAGARVVYYISHESGMKSESKLPGYRAQMMARAVENQIFAVAANAPGNVQDNSGSHGQSRIILPDGNILKEASYYGADVLVETLSIQPGKLTRPLEGVTAEFWKRGLAQLMNDRRRKLGE
ncbi:MAG: carbon-nitrogen hydrolase family protein [Acidobacteria bacterium]|nr:carbon-nitrogen hydrolase family protein [Acidobacteriota bacterium]